jgi:hypothetical protein
MTRRLIAIYLNDHLAGATIGVQLARRAWRENRGTELGEFLAELLREIEEDRETLEQLISGLGSQPSRTKRGAGWALEKLGRFKLNGRLVSYSPLSRLLELEGIASGIDAKRALWLALREVEATFPSFRDADLAALVERARSQRERLEPHRLAAAATALR